MKYQSIHFLLITACLLLLLGSYQLPVQGGGPAQQLSPPLRPTITSIPRPTVPHEQEKHKDTEVGAHIILKLVVQSPTLTDWWTVVQWQGLDGEWHDVDGWRGYAKQDKIRWFVEQAQFGQGPFRWLVYDQEDGILLVSSDNFYLPRNNDEAVTTIVNPCYQANKLVICGGEGYSP